MTIAIHCSDICWERKTDGLPRQCDLKLKLDGICGFKTHLDNFQLPDAAVVDAYLSDGLSEILQNGFGQKPAKFLFSWETDFSHMKNLAVKIARRQYSAYCKTAECPERFSAWLKKQLYSFNHIIAVA